VPGEHIISSRLAADDGAGIKMGFRFLFSHCWLSSMCVLCRLEFDGRVVEAGPPWWRLSEEELQGPKWPKKRTRQDVAALPLEPDRPLALIPQP